MHHHELGGMWHGKAMNGMSMAYRARCTAGISVAKEKEIWGRHNIRAVMTGAQAKFKAKGKIISKIAHFVLRGPTNKKREGARERTRSRQLQGTRTKQGDRVHAARAHGARHAEYGIKTFVLSGGEGDLDEARDPWWMADGSGTFKKTCKAGDGRAYLRVRTDEGHFEICSSVKGKGVREGGHQREKEIGVKEGKEQKRGRRQRRTILEKRDITGENDGVLTIFLSFLPGYLTACR